MLLNTGNVDFVLFEEGAQNLRSFHFVLEFGSAELGGYRAESCYIPS